MCGGGGGGGNDKAQQRHEEQMLCSVSKRRKGAVRAQLGSQKRGSKSKKQREGPAPAPNPCASGSAGYRVAQHCSSSHGSLSAVRQQHKHWHCARAQRSGWVAVASAPACRWRWLSIPG